MKTIPCFNFAFLDKEEKTRKHPQFSWWSPGYQFTMEFCNKWKYGSQDGKPMAWESAGVNLVNLLFGVWMN